MSEQDRSLIGAIAANERWARTTAEQRADATAAARAAIAQRYADRADPHRTLTPAQLADAVARLRRADMARLTLMSIRARRARAEQARARAEAAELDAIEAEGAA